MSGDGLQPGHWYRLEGGRLIDETAEAFLADVDALKAYEAHIAAELRARAEKAEAEVARLREGINDAAKIAFLHNMLADTLDPSQADPADEPPPPLIVAELDRLRDGIQALADEAARRGIESGPPLTLTALRGLLSPTPEGPTT